MSHKLRNAIAIPTSANKIITRMANKSIGKFTFFIKAPLFPSRYSINQNLEIYKNNHLKDYSSYWQEPLSFSMIVESFI